jgi:hypothetical protein
MLGYRDGNVAPDRSGARRAMPALFCLLACTMIGALLWVAIAASRSGETYPPVTNPPGMVDHLDFFDTAARWADGSRQRIDLLATTPERLILHDSRDKFPREGTWASPEVTTAFPFTELIPSYNPNCPPKTGLRFDIRTRDARSGHWSPWFYLGCWGQTLGIEPRIINDPTGKVDIDTLILHRPADAYQARVTFYSLNLDARANPTLRRLAISYSGIVRDAAEREKLISPVSIEPDFARDLPVPFRAQGLAAKPLRPEICSPTSVSMVMQYLGFDRPTEENALSIYDTEYGLFGNWARAVAWAGENGFDAWLTRFRSWGQVKATIAQGQPIIASIRFKKGQCPSFVMQQTAGHLIVIRGVTKDGDLIVNDPASKDKGNGAIYKAKELEIAWFGHGGVGYIIRRPATSGGTPLSIQR